ncbi:MAG: hypothetical protein Q8P06_02490 [Candidatus Azambacteria bacterium]|nr:hypothetical protein [Candidatus Azambacteria bacterium]
MKGKISKTADVVVYYDRSIEDGVTAGKYIWSNKNITSDHFLSKESGINRIFIEVVCFERYIWTSKALGGFKEMDLRPGTLKELLALGEQFPNFQREFPIVELGSIWRDSFGFYQCAALDKFCSGRDLNLISFDGGWSDYYRFVAVSLKQRRLSTAF